MAGTPGSIVRYPQMSHSLLGRRRYGLVMGLSVAMALAIPAYTTAASAHLARPASGEPGIDAGYWIGRQVASDIALEPAVGVQFIVDPDTLARIMALEPAAPLDPADPVTLLEAVDTSGAPTGREAYVPGDLSPRAQAELIIAELASARQLADHQRLGQPGSRVGARARKDGHLMVTAAKAQADRLLVAVHTGELDMSELDGTAQARLLEAFSQLVYTVDPDGPFGAVYGDGAFLPWFNSGVAIAYEYLPEPESTSLTGQAFAVRALAWRLTVAEPETAEAVFKDVAGRVPLLTASVGEDLKLNDAAAVLEGLAIRFPTLSGPSIDDAVNRSADTVLAFLEAPDGTIELDTIASIVRGLTAYAVSPATDNRATIEAALGSFLDSAVINSQLVTGLHHPSAVFDSIDTDTTDDELVAPAHIPQGAAEHPRFRSAIRFSGTAWVASDVLAPVDVTLALASALFSTPPPVFSPSDAATTQRQDVASQTGEQALVTISITSTEFAFDPDRLDILAGSDVTLTLVNEGAVLHNIEIPGLGVFVEADIGAISSVTFTAPESLGDYEFVCNLPGHAEAGMTGSMTIGAPPTDVEELEVATVVPTTTPLPPDVLGADERQGLGWPWIVALGMIAVLLVLNAWTLRRFVIALDQKPQGSAQLPPAGAENNEKGRSTP